MALISVIIPTHNRLPTLPRALRSISEQRLRDWELVVVDDGSTDGTAEWLEQQPEFNGPAPRARLLTSSPRGVSHARNLGINAAQGEWLAFLDSDDEWLPDKLTQQMELAQQHPELRLIHANEIWIRNGIRVNECKHHAKGGGRLFSASVPRCVISPSAVLIHRELLNSVGHFNESFPVCEDYELWLRITAEFDVGFVSTPLIHKYGGHADQLSRQFPAMDYWRVKALLPFLKDPRLSDEERQLVTETLKSKCEILLRGYQKHHNLERFAEVQGYQQLF